jgi:hypothetical protein
MFAAQRRTWERDQYRRRSRFQCAVHAQSSSPATDLRDKVAPDARAATELAAEELAALRNVDETGALRKQCGT